MDSSNVLDLGMYSLFYVSRSSLALEGDADAVNEIVSAANSRNGPLRVTGALIYTELHFAQLLEGPARAIEELMSSIRADKRHCDVTVVAERKILLRSFEKWEMAYSGSSPSMDRYLKPLISPVTPEKERPRLISRLMNFMQQWDDERTRSI